MPIYDQSYRPYRGPLSSHAMRWWTITRTGILHVLSKRIFLILLTITFFYPVIAGFQIYFTHQFPEQQFVTIDAAFFRLLMEIQLFWFLVLGVYPGTGLISNDLRWNAIQLYLSKPLTKVDYVVGKLAILGAFLLAVTMVPGLLLFAIELGFSSDLSFLMSYWWLPFSIVGFSVSASFLWALIVLALSSLSKSSRYVGILFISLVLLGGMFAAFAYGLTSAGGVFVISITDELKQLNCLFFGGETLYGKNVVLTIVMFFVLAGLSSAILRNRVRAVEIVK